MSHQWDELLKSLAEESLPRRESLRRIGVVLAGAVLSPLGVGTAWARGRDPCKAFCRCRNKSQQQACLAACNACYGDTTRLCGSCGSYVCCREPGPWEYGACINGNCEYACAEGAVYCDGFCTFLRWDPNNCGACGNVCPADTACTGGVCGECPGEQVNCGGECVYLSSDHQHCGTCFNDCASFRCVEGVCVSLEE